MLIKSFCLRRQSVSMPFTGVQFGCCRSAGTLTDEQDTVQCCWNCVMASCVCPLSVGKHPGICTLKPMRNAGFQMWRYRIRSTRIFNLPLNSSLPTPPVPCTSQCIFTVCLWCIIKENVTSKRLLCVCNSLCKDFDFERFSDFTAELIRDASSLGCYAVSTGKRFGAEFCLQLVDKCLPVDTT
jgi:hypothetical protein